MKTSDKHSSNKPSPEKRLLGRILVDGGFITEGDLSSALEQQQRTNELLGKILVRMNLISSKELKAVLHIQEHISVPAKAFWAASSTRRLLGEILIKSGRITQEQLESALQDQRKTGEKLGDILLNNNWVKKEDLERALVLQDIQSSGLHSPPDFKLGELLIASGVITRDELQDALQRQGTSGRKLGEILVEHNYISHEGLTLGLKLQSKLVTAAIVASLAFGFTPTSDAAGSSVRMLVSATVLPYLHVDSISQAGQINITKSDISRGYVDINDATVFYVTSNSRGFYEIAINNSNEHIKGIVVAGEGVRAELPGSGGVFQAQYTGGKGGGTQKLSYRFILDEKARPGNYSWPIFLYISLV